MYNFSADGGGSDPQAPSPGAPNGIFPGPLVLGEDGNFYGTSLGSIEGVGFFRLSPAGEFTMLHMQDKAESQFDSIRPLVQADDGNFYAAAGRNIVQISPQGVLRIIYAFPSGTWEQAGVRRAGGGGRRNQYGTCEFSGYDSSGKEDGKGLIQRAMAALPRRPSQVANTAAAGYCTVTVRLTVAVAPPVTVTGTV